MLRTVCKSKIHRATVTESNLQYAGSLTLDSNLMKAAELLPFEQVHVVNVNNGSRFETYLIEGLPGSGAVCLNGAAARLGVVGDKIIIISYAQLSEQELEHFSPKVVFLDEQNKVIQVSSELCNMSLLSDSKRLDL
jgi:aspartate 1-decarboxylase